MKIGIAHASPDSALALELALTRDQQRIAWTVHTGRDAIAKAAQLEPDLILLDASIGDPGCVEVTRRLMSEGIPAILLVVDRPEARMAVIYEAMGLGALDVVTCPVLRGDQLSGDSGLLAKIATVRKILGMRTPSRKSFRPRENVAPKHKLVAIGASTGGPQALTTILSSLPRDLNASLVIVQHVDREFSSGLAEWLGQSTNWKVQLADPGSRPTPGVAWLAGSNDHLVLTRNGSFDYTPEPREVPYRPSVDALFHSLAEHWSSPAIAVLLTGMGRDGARGMKALRAARWQTIAQDEKSCVVFGMPKAAIDLGAAVHVLPLSQIAQAIVDACR